MRPWLFLILGLTIIVSFLYRDKSDLEILLDKAEDGDSEAQYEVGWMYDTGQSALDTGESVPVDDTEAFKWYRKAAEQDDADAQYSLGGMYQNGEGVVKDNVEALKWFRKAAEQDNANAQYNIGVMYHKGEGVAKDDTEAFKWYRKAAEQDLANAQNNFAIMYRDGEGVAKDDVEALKWFNLAAAQGHKEAKEAKTFLVSQMTKEQVGESGKTETAALLLKHGGKTGDELKAEGK